MSDASVKVALPRRLPPLLTRCTTSPPTATITGRDCRTARSAIWVASSGLVVSAASYGIPVDGSQPSIADHSRAARPAPDAGLTMKSTSATLQRASEGVRIHDPGGIDCLLDRSPHLHPTSHLVGDPPCPHLTGAVVVADGSAKLQRRCHRSLPGSVVSRPSVFFRVPRAREREVGAAALLIGMTEMA